jgi:hypothetical protein
VLFGEMADGFRLADLPRTPDNERLSCLSISPVLKEIIDSAFKIHSFSMFGCVLYHTSVIGRNTFRSELSEDFTLFGVNKVPYVTLFGAK